MVECEKKKWRLYNEIFCHIEFGSTHTKKIISSYIGATLEFFFWSNLCVKQICSIATTHFHAWFPTNFRTNVCIRISVEIPISRFVEYFAINVAQRAQRANTFRTLKKINIFFLVGDVIQKRNKAKWFRVNFFRIRRGNKKEGNVVRTQSQ